MKSYSLTSQRANLSHGSRICQLSSWRQLSVIDLYNNKPGSSKLPWRFDIEESDVIGLSTRAMMKYEMVILNEKQSVFYVTLYRYGKMKTED